MRIFAVSDIHTDFKRNWSIISELSSTEYRKDTLILAGDIGDHLNLIGGTLAMLRSKFHRVFYVPGNHELWVRTDDMDSIEKFSLIVELCARINVETKPAKVSGVWILPLFSWYHPSFDTEPESEDDNLEAWADFRFCKWPDEIRDASDYFVRLNEPNIRRYDGPVISFSHFLPRPELLPPRKRLRFKGLPRVAGSKSVEDQIRRLNSMIHVFGHSHINYDCVIDGVRYVQNALAYPTERWYPRSPAKLILDTEKLKQKPEPGFGMDGAFPNDVISV